MNTEIVVINNDKDTQIVAKKAAVILRSGGLVAFPTETVYGLGANIYDDSALLNIYKAKGRPSDNPLIVHISDIATVLDLAVDINENFYKLARVFWPGPLTLILSKRSSVSNVVTGGHNTVAVRMPNHKVALSILRESGVPIAAPSANLSGRPSPTNAHRVIEDMQGRIDMIIDGGLCEVGVESTVLDLTDTKIRILRAGYYGAEDISNVLGVSVYYAGPSDIHVASPGTKYKHYSPKADVILVKSKETLTTLIAADLKNRKKVGVLCTPTFQLFSDPNLLVNYVDLSEGAGLISKELFEIFRRMDDLLVNTIYVQYLDDLERLGGLGIAVLDRLKRAASTIIE